MARAIHRLTARKVLTVKKPGLHPDGGNLYLQVSKTGSKSWIFRFNGLKYERDGRPKLGDDGNHKRGLKDHGLGSLQDVSLSEAREKARECRELMKAGVDPVEHKAAKRKRAAAAAAKVTSFKDCAERFIESRQEGWKNPKSAAQWKNSLAAYVYPTVGDLPVSDVDVNHVMEILEPIWFKKTETAKRVRGRVENVIDWATALNLRSGENPARWRGRLDKLLAAPTQIQRVQHFPALPYDEIGAFMVALRKREGLAARALEFLILTATRTNEVLGAKWPEIDFKAKAWTIPAERMKARREHRVPLSADAIAILKDLRETATSDYIFPSSKPKRPLSNMAMLAVLKRMKRTDLTSHGFRSTFRDWAAETTAYPRELAEKALAHVVRDKAEAAYQRGDLFEKRRRLMDDWATYCATTEAADGDNVVGIGDGRA